MHVKGLMKLFSQIVFFDDILFSHFQVERKRHIGNDIVNIVFIDCDDDKVPCFRPAMMKTHFTRIL